MILHLFFSNTGKQKRKAETFRFCFLLFFPSAFVYAVRKYDFVRARR